MWAWPMATIRWRRRHRGPSRRASAASTLARRDRRRAPGRVRSAIVRSRRARRGSSSASARITPSSTSSRGRALRPRGRRRRGRQLGTGTAARSPAVSGEPRGDGRNCGNVGFDAASTVTVTGPGVSGSGVVGAARMDPLDRLRPPRLVDVDDETLALETRRVAGGSPDRSRASTRVRGRPVQSSGISPSSRNHVVAHGAPHSVPASNGSR